MRIVRFLGAAAALLLFAACSGDAPTGTPAPTRPETPRAPLPLGVYEIAVSGLGNGEMRSSIVPGGAAARAGAARSLAVAGNGLTFEQIGSSSFTEGTRTGGGQRYVSFTYRVRNGTGAALNNLTLLLVSRAGTVAGTPLSTLRRFDGADANPAVARLVVPTGAVAMRSDGVSMQALYPDVVQVFDEGEVAAIPPPGDVTGIFPYGYVVRPADPAATTRRLPAATGANQFDGLLTVSFRLPLQPTAAEDVFSFFFQVLAVDDSEVRMTETMEEAQDTAAVRRLRERAEALGATTVTVLPGSTAPLAQIPDYVGQRTICSVRTAGTPAAPLASITTPGAYTRIEILRPGESTGACDPEFRAGTGVLPTLDAPYALTLRAMDRYGNLLPGVADTVALTQAGGPAGTLPAPVALVNGEATVQAQWSAYGQAPLTARGRRIRGQRVVDVAVPATLRMYQGDNQIGTVGSRVFNAPGLSVRDANGRGIANVPVTFTVTSGGGYVTRTTTVTDGSGFVNAGSWYLGPVARVNTVTATAAGASAPLVFTAYGCSNPDPAGWAISLCYTTEVTGPQRAAFDSAAARWGRVIAGDQPDVSTFFPTQGACGGFAGAQYVTIDDLMILVSVVPIDGVGGTLGAASPCSLRSPGYIPYLGRMRFDAADIANMESNGLLPGVILHEMGHVLGIGTIWSSLSLLKDPSSIGSPALDTYFSGTNAIAAFDALGGSAYAGQKVPVENTGGAGTMNAHWRESVFGSELMTGWANYGGMPLSRVTVMSLQDLGYSMYPNPEDPFTLTFGLRADREKPPVPLGNDILPGPLYVGDSRAGLTRIR